MNLKMDKAGRIVLPKKVRERLRLRPGATLTMEERPEGILLRPVARRASLVEEQGILVHLGQAPADYIWSCAVEDERDERLADVAGL